VFNLLDDENSTVVTSDGVVAYFPGYETPANRVYWWIVDYICDLIYVLDIVFIKRRLRFINNGMLEVLAGYTTLTPG